MKKFTLLVVVAFLASGIIQSQVKDDTKNETTRGGAVARGKYLVEDVVRCERCHTRRDENGQPVQDEWLMGGPVQIRPSYPAPDWAVKVPRIAGEPPGTDAEIIRLLTTGIWKDGNPPRPPMLQLHMTRADAEAVLAYLKSLRREER